MELWFYEVNSERLKMLGIIDNAISVMWVQRFFKGDSFEIVLPPCETNFKVAVPHNIVSFNESVGYITEMTISNDNIITIRGTSIDGMFSKRLLRKYTKNDTVMSIIDKNVGLLAGEIYQFPATLINYNVDCDSGAAAAFYNDNLALYVESTGKTQNFGVAAKINHENNQLELYGRFACDLTKDQTDNPQIVFSDIYDNVTDVVYTYSQEPEINTVYVQSKAQKDATQRLDVDGFFETYYSRSAHGFELSDRYFKIEPVTKIEFRATSEETAVEWTILDLEATQALAQNTANKAFSEVVENVDCKLILNPNEIELLNVGDIITVNVNQYNFTQNKRISELTTFINAKKHTVEATLGSPQNTFSDLLRIRK